MFLFIQQQESLGQPCKASSFTLLNVFWEEAGGVRLNQLLANSSEDCGILTFYSLWNTNLTFTWVDEFSLQKKNNRSFKISNVSHVSYQNALLDNWIRRYLEFKLYTHTTTRTIQAIGAYCMSEKTHMRYATLNWSFHRTLCSPVVRPSLGQALAFGQMGSH